MSAQHEEPSGPTRPRPGHGTVFVMRVSHTDWTASWHDGERHAIAEIWGLETEVLAWARAQPACEKLVFDWYLDTYRPLPMTGQVDVGLARSTREQAG